MLRSLNLLQATGATSREPGSRNRRDDLIPSRLAMCLGVAVLLLASHPVKALEEVMQDDFALANGVPVDPAKWTVSVPNIFKVSSGASWSFLQGTLGANAPAAHAEAVGFSDKDFLVEFDLGRFGQSTDFFDLVLRQNAGGNTRVRFATNAARTKVTVAIMQPGSATVSTSLGETSFPIDQGYWASFRVRINDARVQVFAKESWNREFTLLGEYAPATPAYINSGAGTVRISMPQSAATNTVALDGFKIRRADSGKKVFADFHGHRFTREHDGRLGNWMIHSKSPETPNYIANYNADLMDESGVHDLAAPGEPAIGMQSFADDDYIEYHVLLARMAGIDGFLAEYGCDLDPVAQYGFTDARFRATAEKYGLEFGIDWLDGFFFNFVHNSPDYQAWCTANGKDPALDATKLDYIPIVFQNLIDWVYDQPNAATVGGKPLMLVFQGSPLTAENLAALKTKTYDYGGQTGVSSPFLMPRRAPMGLANNSDPNVQKFWSDPWGWETQTDGTFGWKPMTEHPITSPVYKAQGDERDAKEFARAHVEGMLKTTNDRINMAGVMPGFDNKYCAAWGSYSVELLDRKNGLTYTEVWDQYLQDRDVIDAVLIPTFSDHTEGSGIEPMGDYGDREIRATAKYSAQFKGLADTSASLDFNLPVELFKLRKLAKFLVAAGDDASGVAEQTAILDAAAHEIADASYAAAAAKLASVRATLEAWQAKRIVSTTYTHSFFTGSEVVVSNGVNQNIDIPAATAALVRSSHFDGVITFEYLDDSTFAANKTLYLFSTPTPASTGKPGEWRVCQMEMRHGNGDGQWKTARVALNKKNLTLTSTGIDLYFSALGGATNGGTIRNVTVSLTTYATIPGTWDAGAVTVNLLTPANWAGDAVPASTSAALAGRQDARWDGSVTGPLNLNFGAAFGGSWGVGLVMTANQTDSLTLTNTNSAMQNLRIVNSNSATNGGIQIASGAGPLTIGATGAANPIQLVLGQGASALNYYFANNSANTATIEENVTITKGGSHNASLIFSAGNWNVKGVVSNLSGTANAGALAVNDGSVTLSANNTGHGEVFVNGGTLSISAANNLGVGTKAVRLGQTTTSGVLEFTGSVNTTISRLMRVGNGSSDGQAGSGTIVNNGSGVLTFSNATFNEVGSTAAGVNRSLTLSGTNAGNNTISGVIANNNPGLVSVIKEGTGKWILAGANTYGGDTTVTAGILQVNQARLADSADVLVSSGAVLALNFSGTDTIRSLYIDGSKQAGGTWGAVGSGAEHESPLLSGSGFLSVASGAAFSDWADDSGIPGELPGGDFDHDGLANLLEYALGLSPTAPTASPGTFDGSTISFLKGAAASANGDVLYEIETSTTLAAGSWTAATPTVNSATAISCVLPTGLPRIFARLKVTKAN